LLQKRFLLGPGFGDAAQTDLAVVSGRQDNIGALQANKASAFIADNGCALVTPLASASVNCMYRHQSSSAEPACRLVRSI
jgi:hypothetical protein